MLTFVAFTPLSKISWLLYGSTFGLCLTDLFIHSPILHCLDDCSFTISVKIRWSSVVWLLQYWWITLIDFWVLKRSYTPGTNPFWSWCIILFRLFWIWFGNILPKIFAYMIMKDIGLSFSFSCNVFAFRIRLVLSS